MPIDLEIDGWFTNLICPCVMSHTSMCHVTHVCESCHTYERAHIVDAPREFVTNSCVWHGSCMILGQTLASKDATKQSIADPKKETIPNFEKSASFKNKILAIHVRRPPPPPSLSVYTREERNRLSEALLFNAVPHSRSYIYIYMSTLLYVLCLCTLVSWDVCDSYMEYMCDTYMICDSCMEYMCDTYMKYTCDISMKYVCDTWIEYICVTYKECFSAC